MFGASLFTRDRIAKQLWFNFSCLSSSPKGITKQEHLESSCKMEAPKSCELLETGPKPEVIYRCKKCRRMLASQENVVPHQHGGGWRGASKPVRRSVILDEERPQCSGSSIFVEPLKWMESLEDVQGYLNCVGCNARLGFFSWYGLLCDCGAWVGDAADPGAFKLHKKRIDECRA
ncbi:hypothetical protein RJ640_021933 [Escallonia rubra]|uniref:Dual specificity protein phosphatase 12 n=1 Tax=Escallonia rubra TaxID=112253 RepID=A0AA88UWE0_9ASTE|nr:hypothetical protein RJ640_021933 [Escallonia rubra]